MNLDEKYSNTDIEVLRISFSVSHSLLALFSRINSVANNRAYVKGSSYKLVIPSLGSFGS